MKIRATLFICCTFASTLIYGQHIFTPDDYQPDGDFKNIWSKNIYTDSLATSSLLWIKGEIKTHRHEFHTEHVYILEGTADMRVGGENISVIKGDIVIIPMNSLHSMKVTSMEPLKAISIKSPEYFGKDRVFVD